MSVFTCEYCFIEDETFRCDECADARYDHFTEVCRRKEFYCLNCPSDSERCSDCENLYYETWCQRCDQQRQDRCVNCISNRRDCLRLHLKDPMALINQSSINEQIPQDIINFLYDQYERSYLDDYEESSLYGEESDEDNYQYLFDTHEELLQALNEGSDNLEELIEEHTNWVTTHMSKHYPDGLLEAFNNREIIKSCKQEQMKYFKNSVIEEIIEAAMHPSRIMMKLILDGDNFYDNL